MHHVISSSLEEAGHLAVCYMICKHTVL